jgi:hypothetical protein
VFKTNNFFKAPIFSLQSLRRVEENNQEENYTPKDLFRGLFCKADCPSDYIEYRYDPRETEENHEETK